MDQRKLSGNRIAPIPLQGGVQTIQQSIYLTHLNPCGQNQFLENEVGDTGITYRQFAQILTDAINQPECLEAFQILREAVSTVSANPTEQNVLEYLDKIFNYARIVWEEAIEEKIKFDGYDTVFTCYEANGTTIFDSSTKQFNPTWPTYWSPVYRDPTTKVLSYTPLTMIVPQPFTFNPNYNPATGFTNPGQCALPRFPGLTPPLYPPDPINPYCVLSEYKVRFYGILGTPSYWPYIWKRAVNPYGDQEYIADSAFLINQTAMTESVMAIASILVDPANTRTYPAIGFGFSARATLPGNGTQCYNVCFMQFLRKSSSASIFESLEDIFFVRLSLHKKNI